MELEPQADWLEKYKLVRGNAWEFLKIIRTIDPADRTEPIKDFPAHLDYLKLYAAVWQKRTKIAVPKSRRMKLTWINVALYLWDAMFHKGRHIAFISKKEEHSDDLIKKCKTILENIDPNKFPKEFIPKYEVTFNKLKFPEIDSIIQGFPSGVDQLRQFTFSGLFFDEMAFLDDSEGMYSASLPTIEGGGRFTAVSSPGPGFFRRLVWDELDGPTQNRSVKYPMQGVEIYENEKNQFTIFQVHYTADPEKRDPEYIKHIRESMPIRKFKQEYELEWESFEGLSVFADWDINVHGVKAHIQPQIGLPLLMGLDFGLTPAAVVCQLQEETLCILREFTALNMGAERFFAWLVPQLRIAFPRWMDFAKDWLVFIDPSGQFRKDTDEGSCAKVVDENGFRNVIPGPVAWDERKNGVDHFLTRRTHNGPCFKISIPDCPILVRGFQGGYRYDDKVLESEPNKLRPKKDIHSHPHDALQYVASKILLTRPSSIVDVPRLHYQWGEFSETSPHNFSN